MIIHICVSAGWEFRNVWDEMTLPELFATARYLRVHPPTHLLVAAVIGYKVPDQATRAGQTRAGQPTWETESMEELVARWTAAGGSVG